MMIEDIMDSDELKLKMRRLKPELQTAFMKYMREMCDQETDMMISFISESRMEIKNSNHDMHREQQALKSSQMSFSRAATSISLRDNERVREGTTFSLRSERAVRRTPEPRIDEVHNKLAVERYVRKRDKERQFEYSSSAPGSPEPSFEQHNKSETPVAPLLLSDNTDSEEETHSADYNQETAEILEEMRTVSARIENERERQAARVKLMKEQKRAKREQHKDEAQIILETAGTAHIVKQKDKERQEQKVKELLERKKKERDTPQPRASPLPFLVTPLPDVIEDETTMNEPQHIEEVSAEPGPLADNEMRALRRKKKKAREKEREGVNDEEEMEDAKEKKEKKKKKKEKKKKEKSKEKEEGEKVDKEEKRKKKKKKKDKEKEKPEEFVNVAWE